MRIVSCAPIACQFLHLVKGAFLLPLETVSLVFKRGRGLDAQSRKNHVFSLKEGLVERGEV